MGQSGSVVSAVNRQTLFHSLRVIAGCSLLGTAAAGTLFGWVNMAGVHETGALLGAALGLAANFRHLA
jgi:hypothetical protein